LHIILIGLLLEKHPVIRFLRILLLPFAMLYGMITWLRNVFYSAGIFKQHRFDIPVICVGNLSVGGTGKTPMVEFIAELLLEQQLNVAVLSRGYGRKSKGFILADDNSNAALIGDEPMQLHQKFPGLTIAVDEKRVHGIKKLLEISPEIDVVLLDDAFQHRAVKAGMNVLLTPYHSLYSSDFMLPTGYLREFRCGAKRADMIVVTKCPPEISASERETIVKKLKPDATQDVFFSHIRYGKAYGITSEGIRNGDDIVQARSVLLFAGIANPAPLETHLKQTYSTVVTLQFRDHQDYANEDLYQIRKKFTNFAPGKNVIITTSKDAARLTEPETKGRIDDLPIFCLPVKADFYEPDKQNIITKINSYARKN
jgi:tetraacyldisaccharide 4'-kinase